MTDKDRPAIEQTWRVTMGNLRKGGEPYCDGIVRVDGMHKHGHTPVVETDSGVYPPNLDQAHLIAAAPELYRALHAIYCAIEGISCDGKPPPGGLVPMAVAALRKARGE